MMQVMTDQEWIEHSEKQIKKVAEAFVATRLAHPETTVEALSQFIFMINGPKWMEGSDMARARVLAKQLETDS